MATTPVVLSGESHGQRSLAGYSPTVHRVAKSWTQLSTNKRSFLWWWNVSCLKGIKERYFWRSKTAQDHPRDSIYSVYQLCGIGLASERSEGRAQKNIWWDSGSGVGDSLMVGEESACNARDPDSIPGSRRSSGEGIGYPLQYSWASLVASW